MAKQSVGHKIKLRKTFNSSGLNFIGVWFIVVSIFCCFYPLTANSLTSISQSYKSEDDLSIGSIVSIKANSSNEVIASTSNNVDAMIGVVIKDGESILSLTNKDAGTVQVATSEIASVLVSDINGEVKKGDQITASPIKGVGMKATNNIKVVGVAQEDPIGDTVEKYTNAEGVEQTVKLGQVKILVNVSYYYKEPEKTLIPTSIQNVANALAGKTVEPLPIIIAGAIFIITMVVVVSIVYSMVRSSIISVGRNPLSQSAIYRDLIQLSALVLVILFAGMIAIYLILTRM